MKLRFTGFRKLCEQDFKSSNMDGVLARDLNITPEKNDGTTDVVSPGSAIQFKGHQLKSLNKLLGIDGEDVAVKLINVLKRNKYGVQIQDITGGCDRDGLNTGREYGHFSDRPFPNAPCSPTNGRTWWISAKDWDNIRMPLPPGQGGGAGGGPMGGGPPMGGMGGGPPAGGAPPAGPAPSPGGGPPPPT